MATETGSLAAGQSERALRESGPALRVGAAPGWARELLQTETVARVLVARGFDEPERARRFLEPRLRDLTPPGTMRDRDVAAERLARAARAKERVCVFGDYDCDGMTSTAIITDALRRLGAEVVTCLASRFAGGYGVSPEATERILETGATLVITCDCGSSDHEQLARLVAAGRDVVTLDHHLVPDQPLPALAFLNPNRPDCDFPYKGLASCGLALSLVGAVRAKLGTELDLNQYLDLVALGTIADVAPLDGDNRALVRAGLAVIAQGKRPGIRALLDYARLGAATALSSEDVAFKLAPRLNAPGRLGAPDAALDLLLADTAEAAQGLAARLEQATQERRARQEEILVAAVAEVERERLGERSAIVVGAAGWNHGIVGIVAARLVERYRLPVVVVGFDGETGRGSVRGPTGARLHDAVSAASSTLERWGGHQAAAGVTVSAARFGDFRAAFEDACAALAAERAAGPGEPATPVYDYESRDRPSDVVRDLDRLEPCGARNPAPAFRMNARVVSARKVSGGHLKLQLDLGDGSPVGAFLPADKAAGRTPAGLVELVGTMRWDTWRGGEAVEVRLESMTPAG